MREEKEANKEEKGERARVGKLDIAQVARNAVLSVPQVFNYPVRPAFSPTTPPIAVTLVQLNQTNPLIKTASPRRFRTAENLEIASTDCRELLGCSGVPSVPPVGLYALEDAADPLSDEVGWSAHGGSGGQQRIAEQCSGRYRSSRKCGSAQGRGERCERTRSGRSDSRALADCVDLPKTGSALSLLLQGRLDAAQTGGGASCCHPAYLASSTLHVTVTAARTIRSTVPRKCSPRRREAAP